MADKPTGIKAQVEFEVFKLFESVRLSRKADRRRHQYVREPFCNALELAGLTFESAMVVGIATKEEAAGAVYFGQ